MAATEAGVKNSLIFNENKAMLRRISIILTAPVQFCSTKDYYEMKKMVFPKSQSTCNDGSALLCIALR
jgi:hypothetical protein